MMIDNCGNIYGNPIDNTKQALIDSLAEESTMVISTAYAYAKNYVMYGEDITKAWTTAVQQSSVLQKARQDGWVEAYDSFRQTYDNQLKKDAIEELKKIRAEIADYGSIWVEYKITGHRDKDIEQIVEDVLKQAKAQVLDVIDKAIKEQNK